MSGARAHWPDQLGGLRCLLRGSTPTRVTSLHSHSAGGGPPGQTRPAGHAAGHRSGAALYGHRLASDCCPVLHPSHPRLVVPSIPSQSHIALSSLSASQSHIALSSPGPVTQCRLFACPVGRSVGTAAGGGPAGGARAPAPRRSPIGRPGSAAAARDPPRRLLRPRCQHRPSSRESSRPQTIN